MKEYNYKTYLENLEKINEMRKRIPRSIVGDLTQGELTKTDVLVEESLKDYNRKNNKIIYSDRFIN